MSISDEEERRSRIPGRVIVEAYRECVQARVQYIKAVNANRSPSAERARSNLQDAVLQFYEVLRYKLEEESAVEEYWEEKPVFERVPVPRTNDDGEYVYNDEGEVYVERYENVGGLQRLDGYIGATETVEREINDVFGHRKVEETRPVQMSASLLIKCAHALEAAADDLGLLARVDASTPRTQITEDMIEEVEQWEQAHKR